MDIGLGKAIGEALVLLAFIVWIIFLIISPWFLMGGLKAAKVPERGRGKTIVTAVFNWLLLLVPIVGLIIQWFVIKSRHKTTFGKSILAWLIGVIVPLILIILVITIIFQLQAGG